MICFTLTPMCITHCMISAFPRSVYSVLHIEVKGKNTVFVLSFHVYGGRTSTPK